MALDLLSTFKSMSTFTPVSQPKRHAKFSASASERWVKCPGSIRLSEKAPPQKESQWAAEGTKAHEALEYLLKLDNAQERPSEFYGKYPVEMQIHAIDTCDYIRYIKSKNSHAFLLTETKVSLEHVYPKTFGTVDAAIVEEFGRLTVIDYKYGVNVVEPKENSQMIFYALGLAHKYHYNFLDVELIIIQPRAKHGKGSIRSWVTTIDELKSWEEKFKIAIEAALLDTPPLASGGHCRYCPASSICPEIYEKKLAKAKATFSKN